MRRSLLVAIAASLVVATSNPAQAAAPVTKRLAVVVIQNGDTATERNHLADTGYIESVFFGEANSLSNWMPLVTQGQLGYVKAGAGVFTAQTNDELVAGSATAGLSGAAQDTAKDHLANAGVAWDSLAIVFDIGACGWGGLGQMPGKVTWYPPRPSLAAIVHEFGHNHGYPHEAKHDCPGGQMPACKANGYSGNTPMGSGGAGRGYSSVELLHSGWIPAASVVRTSQPGTYTLKALYGTGGTKVVEYKASTKRSYVVELRSAVGGVDSAITTPGVRIYVVNSGNFRNAYMINPGGPVVTDAENKLIITVRSASATDATVAFGPIAAPKPSAEAMPSPTPSESAMVTLSPSGEDSEPNPNDADFVDLASPPAAPTLTLGRVLIAVALVVLLALAAMLLVLLRKRPRPKHRA